MWDPPIVMINSLQLELSVETVGRVPKSYKSTEKNYCT